MNSVQLTGPQGDSLLEEEASTSENLTNFLLSMG